jgi:hypothetical protein
VIEHYLNDSSTNEWRKEMCAMWDEEVRPIQDEPHDVVFDASTPMLLRRQAA